MTDDLLARKPTNTEILTFWNGPTNQSNKAKVIDFGLQMYACGFAAQAEQIAKLREAGELFMGIPENDGIRLNTRTDAACDDIITACRAMRKALRETEAQ